MEPSTDTNKAKDAFGLDTDKRVGIFATIGVGCVVSLFSSVHTNRADIAAIQSSRFDIARGGALEREVTALEGELKVVREKLDNLKLRLNQTETKLNDLAK